MWPKWVNWLDYNVSSYMIKYSAVTQISSECAKIPSFHSHLHILQAIRHPTSPTPTQVDVSHWCTVFGGYVRCHLQFIPARKIHPLTVQYPKYNIYPGRFLLILNITFCSGPSPHIEGQQRTCRAWAHYVNAGHQVRLSSSSTPPSAELEK